MDDGPRTGGLQALLLLIGGAFAYVTIATGAWLAAPIAIAAFAGLIWLERYARRRAREEERERDTSIDHLDFDADPFDRR